MSKYIDQEAFKSKYLCCGYLPEMSEEEFDKFPTADVVEVVRCKDCKYSTLPSELTQRYGVPGTLTCHNRYSPCNRRNVGGEDFCNNGEWRENDGRS